MNAAHYQDNCYNYLIASAAPCLNVIPEDIIVRQCESTLGTRDVHLIYAVDNHFVFYLAVPSRLTEPDLGFATPLTQALPGHRLHRGDGIYRVNQSGRSHICIKTGTQLRCMSNLEEVIDDHIGGLSLPVFTVTGEAGDKLQRLDDIYRIRFDKLNKPMQWLGVAGILLSTFVAAGAKLYEATQIEIPDYVTPAIKRAESLSQELVTTQQVTDRMSRFDDISTVAIRAGGWIEYFEIDGSGQEQFLVMLPEWVTQDYILALGPGVVTDLAEPGLIKAVKGDKKP